MASGFDGLLFVLELALLLICVKPLIAAAITVVIIRLIAGIRNTIWCCFGISVLLILKISTNYT